MTLSKNEFESLEAYTITYMINNGYAEHEINEESICKTIPKAFANLPVEEQLEYVLLSDETLDLMQGKNVDTDTLKFLYANGLTTLPQIYEQRKRVENKRARQERQARKKVKELMEKYPPAHID